MIEYVRAGIQHASYGIQIAAKIGSQYFNASFGQRVANFAHSFRKMLRAAVGKIVAIDGRNHHIAQFPARAAARATLAGSFGSSVNSFLCGEPLGTEQNPQPRVQRLPRIMNVAAPRLKHS